MRILAVDPGYDRCGLAVLDAPSVGSESLLYSSCVQTNKKDTYYLRIKQILKEAEELINLHKPSHLAIEKLFFNSNQKTASQVSEVRGAFLFLALKENLEILEFTPLQIKLAVTGNGRADKKAIYEILPKLIKIGKEIKLDDEYDAIACALTASAMRKNNML